MFASMGVCIKFASAHFNSSELVFYRGVLGIVLMAAYARLNHTSLRTQYPAMHAWRSLIGVLSLSAWFYAIAHLPLATAMTLNYMSGVWMAAFLVAGTLVLGKPDSSAKKSSHQGPLVLAILASFVGVIMLLRPAALDPKQSLAGLVGLLSGLAAAFAYLQVMAISRMGEPETRTVFYFAVGTAIAGALGMLIVGTSPWNWQHARWLPPMALLASLGQLAMTKAYSMSKNQGGTLMVANLQYAGIVFAALYSLFLFGDPIPLTGWAGMGLIIVSAIAATWLRARAERERLVQEHPPS